MSKIRIDYPKLLQNSGSYLKSQANRQKIHQSCSMAQVCSIVKWAESSAPKLWLPIEDFFY